MMRLPLSAAGRTFYLLAFCGLTGLSAAATRYWDGSSSGSWTTGANWNNPPATAPVAGDDLIFQASGANKSMTNDIGGSPSFYYVKFAGAGYTVSGNPLWVGCNLPPSGLEITHAAGTTTFACWVNTMCVSIADGATLRITSTGGLGGGGNTCDVAGGTLLLEGNGFGAIYLGNRLTELKGQVEQGTVTTSGGTHLFGTGRVNGTYPPNRLFGITCPGLRTGGAGILTFVGEVSQSGILRAEIFSGNVAGTSYDQLKVASLSLSNAPLELLITGPVQTGNIFRLVDQTSVLAIDGVYRDGHRYLTNGTMMRCGTYILEMAYNGGTGNDFVGIVRSTGTASSNALWDGGGTTTATSEAANWSGNILPPSTAFLVFGPKGTDYWLDDKTVTNDTGGVFQGAQISTPHYIISGGPAFSFVDGLFVSPAANFSTFTSPIQLIAPMTIRIEADEFHLGNINTAGHDLTIDCAGPLYSDATVEGVISGSGNVIKKGNETLFLRGGPGQAALTGEVRIQQGTLALDYNPNINPPWDTVLGGNVVVGGGSEPAVLRLVGYELLPDNSTLTIKKNGILEDKGGSQETISLLALESGALNTLYQTTVSGITVTGATPEPAVIENRLILLTGAERFINVAEGQALQINDELRRSAAGASCAKTGPGKLILKSTVNVGVLRLAEGTLEINGDAGTTAVNMAAAAPCLLTGTGKAAAITAAGGVISPAGALTGNFQTMNGFTGAPAAALEMDLSGTAADRLVVSAGPCNPSGAVLKLRTSAAAVSGTVFTIVDNAAGVTVSGTFSREQGGSLTEGSVLTTPHGSYLLSYTGGTGNDITLTAQSSAAPPVLTVSDVTAESLPAGGRRIRMTVSGGPAAAGATLRLQYSDDLTAWTNLGSALTAGAGGAAAFDVEDASAGSARRYYRAVIP